MGRVASSVKNAMMESFGSTMQRELLDRQSRASRNERASAIFEWIEGFYNPTVVTPASPTTTAAPSAPSPSKHFTPVPKLRHHQHTPRVRTPGVGSSSPQESAKAL